MALVKVVMKDEFLPIEQLDALRMALGQFQPTPKFVAEAPFAGQSSTHELISQSYIVCDESIADGIVEKIEGALNFRVKGIESYDDPNNCAPGTTFCRVCQTCRGVTQEGRCQACGNPLR